MKSSFRITFTHTNPEPNSFPLVRKVRVTTATQADAEELASWMDDFYTNCGMRPITRTVSAIPVEDDEIPMEQAIIEALQHDL